MTERGKNHLAANCVVAAQVAERAWLVMRRDTPYVLRDIDGTAVTAAEAKAIIAERYSVSEETRKRRRSNKGGKAPQKVLTEHLKSHAKGVDRTRRPFPKHYFSPIGNRRQANRLTGGSPIGNHTSDTPTADPSSRARSSPASTGASARHRPWPWRHGTGGTGWG